MITSQEEFNHVYPHLQVEIRKYWGTQHGRDFIIELTTDNSYYRPRGGFPEEDMSYIFSLLAAHDEQFPEFDRSKQKDIPFRSYQTEQGEDDNGDILVVIFWAKVVLALMAAVIFFKDILPYLIHLHH